MVEIEIEDDNNEELVDLIDLETVKAEEDADGLLITLAEDEESVLSFIVGSNHGDNLASLIEDETLLKEIGDDVCASYTADKESRKDWEDKIERGMVALGLVENQEKARYKNATKIVHPGLAEAVLHAWARFVKEFWPLNGPVRSDVVGDADEDLLEKAKRQETYMNNLLLYKIPDAFEEDSRAAYELFVIGSAFKKIFIDNKQRINDRFVSATNLIIPYFGATCIEKTPRITEEIEYTRSALLRCMSTGYYREVELDSLGESSVDSIENTKEEISGIDKRRLFNDDMAETFLVLEQHVDLDFGEQPFPLPYIVTVLENTGEVLRIVRNWREGDSDFEREEYYSHLRLPGMGFYGYGFYQLAPGLTDTSITVLRSLVEAGHFANIQGGWITQDLGKKLLESGSLTIGPGEWKIVNAIDDINKSIKPVSYKEPSQTLYNLLNTFDEYRRRLYSTTDVPMGEVTNEMPVGTATLMVEQANVVPNSILLGCHFAKRKEFNLIKRRIYELFDTVDMSMMIKGKRINVVKEDFNDDFDVLPTNDPQTNSFAQQMTKAQTVYQMASNPNSTLDFGKCEELVLKSLRLPDFEILKKQPVNPAMMPPDPMKEMAMADGQLELQRKAQENEYNKLHTEMDLATKAREAERAEEMHEKELKSRDIEMLDKIRGMNG